MCGLTDNFSRNVWIEMNLVSWRFNTRHILGDNLATSVGFVRFMRLACAFWQEMNVLSKGAWHGGSFVTVVITVLCSWRYLVNPAAIKDAVLHQCSWIQLACNFPVDEYLRYCGKMLLKMDSCVCMHVQTWGQLGHTHCGYPWQSLIDQWPPWLMSRELVTCWMFNHVAFEK